MSTGGDADGIRQGAVPAPRGAELPLPPAAVPGGPHDGDIADGLTEAYWSVYDGAASKTTVGQILARLPRIVRQIGRLAWTADRAATIAVVVLQLASAAMTAFGLMASVAVLRELFAGGPRRTGCARPSPNSWSSSGSCPPGHFLRRVSPSRRPG
jgi:ATP-binding cassette, subfamily B, bacterial